jgi:Ca2+-binding RTX toxin-like protein
MSATSTDGELLITGTELKDAIVVTLDQEAGDTLLVSVNKEQSSFPLDQISKIAINALGGNDKVIVSEKAGAFYKNVTVDAGAGNDSVTTGSGNDVIVGGAGNDTLGGGDGDDYLFGGDGNDKLTAGDANDYLDGGDGNDSLTGGGGDDTLLAGNGKDKLVAGEGDDNVDGGGGKDSIKTGSGDDAIAEDASSTKEVKDRAAGDTDYALAELTDDVAALHERVVPGSTVFRAELAEGTMTLYYRFGSDPTAYKTVLDVSKVISTGTLDENVELVSREVSITELRLSAVAVFNQRTPNLGILSFKSTGNGYPGSQGVGAEVIRYRDLAGAIHETTTNDVAWTLDEAEEDLDDDGLFDFHGGDGDGDGSNSAQGMALDPSWTPLPSGDGRTLYQDAFGHVFEPREDGLYYPHQDGGDGGGQ